MSLFPTQTASIRPSSATADGGRFPSSPSCPSIPRKETRCAWHCAAESNGAVHPRRLVPAPIRRGTPLSEKISLTDSPSAWQHAWRLPTGHSLDADIWGYDLVTKTESPICAAGGVSGFHSGHVTDSGVQACVARHLGGVPTALSGALVRAQRPTRQNGQNRRFAPYDVTGSAAGSRNVGSGDRVNVSPARGWRERRCREYLAGAASSCRAWGRPGASGRVDSMHADGSPKGGTCRDYLARLLRGWPLAGDPARVGDAHRLWER